MQCLEACLESVVPALVALALTVSGGTPAIAQPEICAELPDLCQCSQLPGCPDGNTPVGVQGSCTCPRPTDCGSQYTHYWDCGYSPPSGYTPGGWSCACEAREPVDPSEPPDDGGGTGYCALMTCPDGTPAVDYGLICTCAIDN
jgi:hypothetical protein